MRTHAENRGRGAGRSQDFTPPRRAKQKTVKKASSWPRGAAGPQRTGRRLPAAQRARRLEDLLPSAQEGVALALASPLYAALGRRGFVGDRHDRAQVRQVHLRAAGFTFHIIYTYDLTICITLYIYKSVRSACGPPVSGIRPRSPPASRASIATGLAADMHTHTYVHA
jgi:hypothetical protein